MNENIVEEIVAGYEQLVLDTIAGKKASRKDAIENVVQGFVDDIQRKLVVTAANGEKKHELAEKLMTITHELQTKNPETWEPGKKPLVRSVFKVYLISYLLSCHNG